MRTGTIEEEVTTDVVYKVAKVADTDPTDLPPLHDAIDTDALNAFVACNRDSTPASITFHYYGYTVTITGDAGITVSSTA